jgi:hypothetical protein
MPVADANGNGRTVVRLPSLATFSVIIALLVQLGGVIVWATNEHNARVVLQQQVDIRIRDADNRLAQWDARLIRLDEFTRALNDKQNVINTAHAARDDNFEGHLKRMDDRVDRIVQALDQTYNLLRETREQLNKMKQP